jgi:adenylyltransferase/sulfurtransferase
MRKRSKRPRTLTPDERARYARQILLPGIGPAGQLRLKRSRVLVVGTGGLGSPALLYLAAAGVGTLGLADFDAVEVSNLQRQVIHREDFKGRSKIESAVDALRRLNPLVHIEPHETRLRAGNALEIVRGYDVIVDGTDNFPARYLLNDACVLARKPYVYGSVFRFEGQASVFDARRGPCYRCLYPSPPPADLAPDCMESGVLGVVPGLIGLVQAAEALKLLLRAGEPLLGRLLVCNALAMRFEEMRIVKDPRCPACGRNPAITRLTDVPDGCDRGAAGDISVVELKAVMARGERVTVVDVREPHEAAACRIRGATLIPIGELPSRINELDRDRLIVVHCQSGGRSARAAHLLRAAGFPRVKNLAGGMRAWTGRGDRKTGNR